MMLTMKKKMKMMMVMHKTTTTLEDSWNVVICLVQCYLLSSNPKP